MGLTNFLMANETLADSSVNFTTDTSYVFTEAGVNRILDTKVLHSLNNVFDGSYITQHQKNLLDLANITLGNEDHQFVAYLDNITKGPKPILGQYTNFEYNQHVFMNGKNIPVYKHENTLTFALSGLNRARAQDGTGWKPVVGEYLLKLVNEVSSTPLFQNHEIKILLGEEYSEHGYHNGWSGRDYNDGKLFGRFPDLSYGTNTKYVKPIVLNNVLAHNPISIIGGWFSSNQKARSNWLVNPAAGNSKANPSYNTPHITEGTGGLDVDDFSSNGHIIQMGPSGMSACRQLAKYMFDQGKRNILVMIAPLEYDGGDPTLPPQTTDAFNRVYAYGQFTGEFKRLCKASNLVEGTDYTLTDFSFITYHKFQSDGTTPYSIDTSTPILNNLSSVINNGNFDAIITMEGGSTKVKYEDGQIKYVIRSISSLLKDHFGTTLTDAGIHVGGAGDREATLSSLSNYPGAITVADQVDLSLNEKALAFANDTSGTYGIDLIGGGFNLSASKRIIDAFNLSLLSTALALKQGTLDTSGILPYIPMIANGTGDMSGGTLLGPEIGDINQALAFINDGSAVQYDALSITALNNSPSGFQSSLGTPSVWVSKGTQLTLDPTSQATADIFAAYIAGIETYWTPTAYDFTT